MGITNQQKYAAEFLGTFMLVFTVGLTSLIGVDDKPLKVFGPTAIGCVLMVMVYALGPISGGHLNPAVTFAVYLQKAISRQDAIAYFIAQCAGGAAAGIASGFMYGWRAGNTKVGPKDATFWLGAPLVEFLFTFMLCFVVLNVACAKAQKTPGGGLKNNYYGLAIGFVVVAAGIGGGEVSGAALNPAVTIGANFMGPDWKAMYVPIYALCQLAGGFAATTAFHIVRPEEKGPEVVIEGLGSLTKVAYRIEGMFDPEDTAEFLGTFFLCLVISLNALVTGPGANGGVWSVAAALMTMIYAMGDISGGLFNPALTLAFCGRFYGTGCGLEGGPGSYKEKLADPLATSIDDKGNERKAMKEPFKYLLAQMLGGAAGSGTTMLIYFFQISTLWPAAQIKTGNMTDVSTTPHTSHAFTLGQAFFAEIFGTFMLCFVILCVASRQNPLEDYTAFCIGGCIVGAGYAWGPLSGAVLNPAVTIANSICYKLQLIYEPAPVVYILAELCGGVLAAVAYRFIIYSHEFEKAAGLTESLVPHENA